MAWVIVTAKPADLPRMFAIEQASFQAPWSYGLLEAEFTHTQARMRVVYQRDPRGKKPELLVGFCISWVVLDELEILQIAVDPEFRRNGIGRILLRDVLRIAKKEPAPNLHLEVRASNEAAISLYRSCHFEKVGLRKKYYQSPTEDAVVLTLKLDNHQMHLRR